MSSLCVDLPPEVPVEEAAVLLAMKLWETGRLSLGQAAEVAGYTKPAFIEVLGRYGVPLFRHPPEDLEAELNA